MSELWHTTALEDFTLDQVKQIVLENYRNFLQRYLDTRHLIDQNRLMEIRFEDLRSNPVDTLSRVYEQFSLGDFARLKTGYSSSARNEKQHRMNTYSIDEAELNQVLKKLDFAMKHWGYKVPQDLNIQNTRPSKTA